MLLIIMPLNIKSVIISYNITYTISAFCIITEQPAFLFRYFDILLPQFYTRYSTKFV